MRRLFWLGVLICLTASAATGCQEPASLASVELAIINGVPDTDPAHMAVVALRSNRGFCSGTLVAPRVVLTAGHCVHGADPDRFVVYVGNRTREARQLEVSHVRLHPEYSGSTIANDIALLILGEAPPAGVVPIPYLPRALGLTRADEGARIQFVGFGRDERGEFTEKLTVFGTIQWVCDTPERCPGLGVPVKENTLCFDNTQGGICHGDSGGPALIRRDGREYVAGISSYYYGVACIGTACSTQVDAFEEYVQTVIDADLENGQACQDGRRCKSGQCTDGVCCDLACAGRCETCALAGAEGRCTPVFDDALEPGCGPEGGCGSPGLPAGQGAAGLGLGLGLLGLALARARRPA
jgi:hypothetical protein